MEPTFNPFMDSNIYEICRVKWLREMDKLRDEIPPYDCDDDTAINRLTSILASHERKQLHRLEIKYRNELLKEERR